MPRRHPCDTAASHFLSRLAGTGLYPIVYLLGIALILAAPAIIGIFWGAPLIARELEAGTYRLAWTQSITRSRWLVVKLALTGLAAMAVALAVFAAAQVAMPLWVRPHLIPPDRTVVSGPSFFEAASMSVGALTASTVPGQPEAWILSSAATNAAGQPVSAIPAPCLSGPSAGKGASPNAGPCMARRGIREAITYQPASRYWPFQWIETGIFLALALALTGVCFWRLGRRRI